MSSTVTINDTERPEITVLRKSIVIYPLRYTLFRKSPFLGLAHRFFPLPDAYGAVKALTFEGQPQISEINSSKKVLQQEALQATIQQPSSTRVAEQYHRPYTNLLKETEVDKLEVEDLEEPATAGRYEYQFAAAPVRPGWIYMFNEEDKVLREYEVIQGNGQIQCKLQRYNKAGETQFVDAERQQKAYKGIPVDPETKKLRMEFFEIRWDETLVSKVLQGRKQDFIEGFQLFDVQQWVNQEGTQSGVFSRDDIPEHYLPNTSDTLGFKDLYKERLEDKVNPLHHPFVCLHDRLGAANDICHDLYQLEALHEALIHNPKTGIPVAELLSALLEDPLTGVETAKARYQAKKQGHHNFESYEKQYLLAASTFSAIQLELERLQYTQAGSAEAIDELNKQRAKVDWAAITQILQIRARKHMRVNINNTRSSLLTLLQSDYYQHLLLAEFNDYADRLHGFKGELITHDTMLAREPRARDADIVLFYQKRIDLDQYFEQKLAADSPFSKLMEQEVNVGEKILSTAEGGRQILSILETYISYCKGEKEIKIITKYLNSIKLSDFEFKTALATLDDILAYAEEIGLDARLRGSVNDKNIISRTILEVLDSGESIPYIRIAPRATAAIRKVDELLQKAKLEEVGMGLAVFNLVNSIRATQENDGRSATHKAAAIGAASFAVTHSLASYLYARKELSKRLIGRAVGKKLVTRIGYVGDCLTIVESIFNVRQAFLEKNEMQAFAYMGATAAAAASLVFTVKGVSISMTAIMASGAGASAAGTVLLAIWPILVLAALTIFFAWLAASTAYSPQVLFYANYLFNLDGLKDLKLNYAELTCEALMAEIEANKNEIISKTFAHFRDFDAAIREFESLYPMLVINANSEDQQKGVLVYDGRRGADKQFENRVEVIKFEGQFLQFSSDMAVEYGLLSVRPDKQRGNGVGVFFTGFERVEFFKNSLRFSIRYDIRSVSEERFYDDAWFLIRLILNEGQGQYWPITANNQQARYYVVKARLKESGEVKADLNDLYRTSVGREYSRSSTDFLNKENTREAFEDYQKRKTLTIWSVDEFMAETGLQPGRISTIKRSNDEVNPETERFLTNFLKSK